MPKTRQPIVHSWWAGRWVSIVETANASYHSRLTRGRSDATAGHVWPLTVTPGMIAAQVQDPYGYATRVRLELPPLPEELWRSVTTALAGEAASVAKLLAGELPREIEDQLRAAGGSLFPTLLEEVSITCGCYSWGSLCRHAFAALYAFALEIDSEPGLLLTLRGRSVERFVAATRASWAAQVDGTPASDAPDEPVLADAGIAPLQAARYFAAGPALDNLAIVPEPPATEAALLKRLGRPPFAQEPEDVTAALAPIYAAATQRALRIWQRSGAGRQSGARGGAPAAKPSDEAGARSDV